MDLLLPVAGISNPLQKPAVLVATQLRRQLLIPVPLVAQLLAMSPQDAAAVVPYRGRRP